MHALLFSSGLALTRKIEQTNLDMIRQHTWISRRTVGGCVPEENMLLHCKLRRAFSSERSAVGYTRNISLILYIYGDRSKGPCKEF